ncbi:hypothetical protein [Winogradskyella sp.]|uniref:hypothetical protein n=1 Tax=Winogradskyella sp. TaxID=1883156 RepID=UPI003F6C9063
MKTILLILAFGFANSSNAQFITDDDMLHFGAGAILSSATYSIVYAKTNNSKKAFWYSLGVSTLVGLSKELYDEYFIDGRFDNSELLSTITGGFVASYTFNIFTGKKQKKRKLNWQILIYKLCHNFFNW